MSVGHLSRLLENAGIPTLIIAIQAFRLRLEAMNVSRALITNFPMGYPIGFPGRVAEQQAIISAALNLLEGAVGQTIKGYPV